MPHPAPAGLSIRSCTGAELAAVTRIYAHHVAHSTATFELAPPDEAEIARRWSAVQSLGLPWIVASLDGGLIVGYAYASAYRPRIGYRFTVEDSVYVDPAHVGRGIGASLLTHLIELCETAGARQMIAVIGDNASTASIRLHEKFGFRHVGTLRSVGFKFGRWVDTVLMQRPIGESDDTLPNQ
jgi:L-amino acid N-acyltransferase YncA